MNEETMVAIIKNLSDELYATVLKLKETQDRLKTAQSDSSAWFSRWNEANNELQILKGASKLSIELADMEGLNE